MSDTLFKIALCGATYNYLSPPTVRGDECYNPSRTPLYVTALMSPTPVYYVPGLIMLSVTLVLCALVGVSFADFECCTAENRQEVQHLWSDIWSAQFAGRRIPVAQAIFEEWVELLYISLNSKFVKNLVV